MALKACPLNGFCLRPAVLMAGAMSAMLAFSLPSVCAENQLDRAILQRLERNPQDAVSWRLLGRLRSRAGDVDGAMDAFRHALALDPDSAAAHRDLGQLLGWRGQTAQAHFHLQRVLEIAPDSEYAVEVAGWLRQAGIAAVSFETSWSDGPSGLDFVAPVPGSPWLVRLELGGLLNSNVELAPISRRLSTAEQSSFQLFAAPNLQYMVAGPNDWSLGLVANGYFNINENHLRQFNLQHYEAGTFVERSVLPQAANIVRVVRVQYDYTIDAFDGRTFGNRHAITAMLSSLTERGLLTAFFWTPAFTDFRDDGAVPATTSLDGWTHTVGLLRSHAIGAPLVTSLEYGSEVEWADLEGADFAYRAILLYASAELPGCFGIVVQPRLGWGYREYPDFTGSPSRNESIWQASLELLRPMSASTSVTAVFSLDHFDSANPGYKTNRHTAGVYYSFER